jgi:hypothetical protein
MIVKGDEMLLFKAWLSKCQNDGSLRGLNVFSSIEKELRNNGKLHLLSQTTTQYEFFFPKN